MVPKAGGKRRFINMTAWWARPVNKERAGDQHTSRAWDVTFYCRHYDINSLYIVKFVFPKSYEL